MKTCTTPVLHVENDAVILMAKIQYFFENAEAANYIAGYIT